MFYGNLAWFCVVWVSVRVARRLWRVAHPPVRAAVSSPKRKAPRPLKPRTPNDCPVCGRAHPTPLVGNMCKPGVVPWRERKTTRGRPKALCTAGYACPNPDCDNHGNADSSLHALVGHGQRGADGIQWLKCQACGKRFSSRRGTALYRLRTPAAQIAQALLVINLGLSSVARTCPCDFSLLCHNCDGASRPHVAMRHARRRWRLASRTISGPWRSC